MKIIQIRDVGRVQPDGNIESQYAITDDRNQIQKIAGRYLWPDLEGAQAAATSSGLTITSVEEYDPLPRGDWYEDSEMEWPDDN